MILVMLGTGPDSFERLLGPVDELAGRHGWDVFVQIGHTGTVPAHCRYEKFVDRAQLMNLIEESELVIAQGGYGSIRDVLSYGKPLIAVPRYPALDEAPDEQEELVRAMEEQGYLIGVYDTAELESAIERARGFVPQPRPENNVSSIISEYLQEDS